MPDARAERRDDAGLRASAALHAAGFLTLFAAILAVAATANESSLIGVTAAVAAVGNLLSWVLRRKGYSLRLLEIIVIGLVVVVYAKVAVGDSASGLLMPAAAEESNELKLAVLLLWMEVLRSFTLTTDYAILFTAVPSVALLGLMATQNINPEMLLYFVLFLVAAVFMLVHNSSSEAEHVCGDEKKLLGEQVRAALAVGAIAMVAGTIVVTPLRMGAIGLFGRIAPQWLNSNTRPGLQNFLEPGILPIAQGPVRLSGVTVMIVRSDPPGLLAGRQWPLYWRGRVFERYTGHGWSSSDTYSEVLPARRNGRLVVGRGKDGAAYYEYGEPPTGRISRDGELVQFFKMTHPRFTTIYAAGEPMIVRVRSEKVWRDTENNWRAKPTPVRYQVVSQLPEQDPDKLRRSGSDYPEEIKAVYLQRSNGTLQVGELAANVTEGLTNPYDKAVKIADYLSTTYLYDINASPAPYTQDAVEYFLFTSRTGYCDVFASSMVVMLRELGIPSRLVTGFAQGTYEPSLHGFRVRELDRHAWVEVYFPHYGWVPFDPTGSNQVESLPWYLAMVRSVRGSMRTLRSSGMITLAALLIAITVMLFMPGAQSGLKQLTDRSSRRSRTLPSRLQRQAFQEFHIMCRALGRKGVRNSPYTTPFEYASYAAQTMSDETASRLIWQITERFTEIRYGIGGVTREQVDSLRADVRTLRRTLGRR